MFQNKRCRGKLHETVTTCFTVGRTGES